MIPLTESIRILKPSDTSFAGSEETVDLIQDINLLIK